VIFQKVLAVANSSPLAGLQFFGQVDIDGRSGSMTVSLKDIDGVSVFSQKVQPEPGHR
jgi:alkaline phosphatase D